MDDLNNKVALVTGGSKGIGLEIARTLAGIGATVILAARSKDTLEKSAARIVESGGKAFAMGVDMGDEESIRSLVKTIQERFGVIDILVNNAGITHSALLKDATTKDFDRCMQINARGPFILCKEALPLVQKASRGYIINIGSVVSIKGYQSQSAYTASKHALRGMTMSLGEELNKTSVSVHMICPGGVDTGMVGDVRPDINKDELIQPQEIADIVKFIVTRRGKGLIDEFRIRRATSGPWFA
ncbi:MAG: SDR family oxidoreductase [Planctomycetes bacterium]|nr:SDR family oxidoreductase [Planctomycetota bacterium]